MTLTSTADALPTVEHINYSIIRPLRKWTAAPVKMLLKETAYAWQWNLEDWMLRDYFLSVFSFFLYLSASVAAGDWQPAEHDRKPCWYENTAAEGDTDKKKKRSSGKTKLPLHVCCDGLSHSVKAIFRTLQQRRGQDEGRRASLDIFDPTVPTGITWRTQGVTAVVTAVKIHILKALTLSEKKYS